MKISSLIMAFSALALMLMLSCSDGNGGEIESGSFTDPRDGRAYRTVKIGNQTWMAQNLAYNGVGTCYENDESNRAKYGGLYDWATANRVCPSGWHLPSKEEWDVLSSYIEINKGCSGCDAKHLKAKDGWALNGNGLDTYGFAALPGGYGSSDGYGIPDGGFYGAGGEGLWWSASEDSSYYAYDRCMSYSRDRAYCIVGGKPHLHSVRCVMD